MWSNLYVYYNLRSDERYQQFQPVEEIVQILKGTGVLEAQSSMIFGNVSNFPWLNIGIAQTTDGNYSIAQDANYDSGNLLTVVTSRQHDQQIYKDLLIGIARKLQWEVILEEDDHENEDVIIFSPNESV